MYWNLWNWTALHNGPSPTQGYNNWQRSAATCLGWLLCRQHVVYVLSLWKLFYSDRTTLSDIGRPTVQINRTPSGSHKQRCVQKSSAQEGLCFVKRQLNYHTRSLTFHGVNYPAQRKSYQNYIYETWSLMKDDMRRMETVLGFLSEVVKWDWRIADLMKTLQKKRLIIKYSDIYRNEPEPFLGA